MQANTVTRARTHTHTHTRPPHTTHTHTHTHIAQRQFNPANELDPIPFDSIKENSTIYRDSVESHSVCKENRTMLSDGRRAKVNISHAALPTRSAAHILLLGFVACKYDLLVSRCFEPSQPHRITSGLNTNFTLSPSYSFHNSSYNKSCFVVVFWAYLYPSGIQHGNLHQTGWPILFCGPTQEPCASQNQHMKNRERFWKKCRWMDGSVEISKEEIPGSKRSTYGYILTFSRL